MKATFLIVIAAIGFSSISFGQENRQEDTREDLKFGVRAGANLSNVWDENSQDFEANSKLGFAGGAFMSVPLGKFLGIQPGMMYSQKGFEENGRVLGSDYTFTRTTNYLDIPILFELKPKQFLTIVAGPQYSFLMSKTDQFSSGTISVSDVDQYQNENIRKNTLGAVVGFDIHSNSWVISPRAGWDLLSNNGDGSSSSLRYKNQWVQLTIGYEF